MDWSGQCKTLLILHVVKINVIWRSPVLCFCPLKCFHRWTVPWNAKDIYNAIATLKLEIRKRHQHCSIFRNPRLFGQMVYQAILILGPFPNDVVLQQQFYYYNRCQLFCTWPQFRIWLCLCVIFFFNLILNLELL